MLQLIACIILGIFIGMFITMMYHRFTAIGALHIIHTNADEPGMFLELNDEIHTFNHKKYVTMTIRENNNDYYEEH